MEKLENNVPTKETAVEKAKEIVEDMQENITEKNINDGVNLNKNVLETGTVKETVKKNEIDNKEKIPVKEPKKNNSKNDKNDLPKQKSDQSKIDKHSDKKEKEIKDNKSDKSKLNNSAQHREVEPEKQLKKSTNNNSKKKKIIISIIVILTILVGLIISTIFGIITSNSEKIISGISINGIDISNLTKSEAVSKLNVELGDNLKRELTLTHGEYTTIVDTSSIESSYNIEDSVNEAYKIGRSENNIFSNNAEVLKTYFGKKEIALNINYNPDLLDERINVINDELPDKVVDSSYKIENNKLIIANSTNGYRVQRNTLKSNIYSALVNNESNIEIPVEEYQADKVDIDAIYKEVYKEPVDATFVSSPYELHKEENGLDFAISLEEARALVSQDQESYTIPLKVVKPKMTVKSLPQEAFPDQLATYSTTYASSNYNRSTNISLAANAVNGYVLMPGETFSYNGILGQRTTAKGYKEAGVYVNGTVSTDVGGGICQVSSTLYNAVLLCNLEIVDRRNHTFEPSYVPAGQDATVSWQSPDFKFKNNRKYPIKIAASAGSGRITFYIYGVKTDEDYEVKIQSTKTGTIPYSTEYVNDPTLPVGTTKVTQAGSNGCKSQTYKILYKDGKEISRTLINSDTYKPHNQVVAKGTKVVGTPTPTPEPTVPSDNAGGDTQNNTGTNDSSVTITTDIPVE